MTLGPFKPYCINGKWSVLEIGFQGPDTTRWDPVAENVRGEASCKLMAAAPDLLVALKALMAASNLTAEVMENARKAIALAEAGK